MRVQRVSMSVSPCLTRKIWLLHSSSKRLENWCQKGALIHESEFQIHWLKPLNWNIKQWATSSHASALTLTSSTFLFSLALVSKKGMFICCANFWASLVGTTFLSGSSSLLPTETEIRVYWLSTSYDCLTQKVIQKPIGSIFAYIIVPADLLEEYNFANQ